MVVCVVQSCLEPFDIAVRMHSGGSIMNATQPDNLIAFPVRLR
jgi:hypothetical protein